ncbi:MAG: signal peptidase I [Nitrincola lacisaponensis]|uniref:Signal peptidase I n=1 Tax=Nitrincola lacisaponensis TaxID=267850 RepID=A0A063XZP6_9GAMM|nr:signal peptidase I [Nitrincola lacisaponensis]KDE39563.1 Signal peptidase I [Nitrincola lacisaponensis]
MDFDFSLVLVTLTAVTGLLWLVDSLFFAPGRRACLQAAEAESAEPLPESTRTKILQQPGWADLGKSMFPVLAVVLVLRSFLFEPFQIPSGSMLPTLQIGDFILVNKFHYGVRLPVVNTRVLEVNDPQRGEVAVFRYPNNPSINYIKRVIGVPGDVISYHNKTFYINGEALEPELLARLPPVNPEVLLLQETLGEHTYTTYQDVGRPSLSAQWVVPEGHYFTVGDNRDNSNDSRYWGFVSENLLVGKAVVVWMHWDNFFSLPDFSVMRKIR